MVLQVTKYWAGTRDTVPQLSIVSVLIPTIYNYHTSNSHKCMGVNGEALQLHSVYEKNFPQVMQESMSVLQVMRESVSGTASHTCCV